MSIKQVQQNKREILIHDFEKGLDHTLKAIERELSARKIAEGMKITRHTIDSDVQYLYSTLQRDDNRIGTVDLINKQLVRFEYQRNRLMQSFEIPILFRRIIKLKD